MLAHIDLDAFLVAVERRRNPELRDRPLVLGGPRHGRGAVAAASREARRQGVHAGMPLAEAAIRCPEAVFLTGSVDAYIEAQQQVDAVLRQETPDVEWVSVDEAYLAFPPSVDPLAAVAAVERVQASLQAMGFDAGCGIARTRTVASVASRLARPRGVMHILDGYEARFLSPLKIEMLPGLEPGMARQLRAAGVRRLGQLAHLSETELTQVAGRTAAVLGRHATGTDGPPVRSAALPPPRIQDTVLDSPTADTALLEAALTADACRLAADLRARNLYARTLTLRLRYADGRVEGRLVTLSQPSALDDALSAAVMEAFVRAHRPHHLVRAFRVTTPSLVSSGGAPALFL